MNILKILEQESGLRRLDFLIIGGHAVNEYGWSRETADIDILARRENRDDWLKWFRDLGYSIYHDGGTFTQLASPETAWPVDFLWVNDSTFSGMMSDAVGVQIGPASVRIPSLQHLLALKLHSLKNARVHRFLKDFQDVVGLIEVNKLDPASEKVRILFQKYANDDLYEKVARALSKN